MLRRDVPAVPAAMAEPHALVDVHRERAVTRPAPLLRVAARAARLDVAVPLSARVDTRRLEGVECLLLSQWAPPLVN